MIDASSLDLVLGFADLGVILILAGLLLLAYTRGFLKKQLQARYGQVIVVGLSLAVLAHVWEIGYTLLNPVEVVETPTFATTFFSVERIHFLISLAGFAFIAIGVSVAILGRKQSASEILDTRRELEISKYFEYQAEERFRYLFDSTSNSVYCYRFDPPMPIDLPVAEQVARSFDAILQDCNVMFARDLEAEDPSEVIGSRLGALDSSKDTAAHEAYFKTFIEGDYRLDGYELEYRDSGGNVCSFLINMVGIVREGLLHRMWAVESNVTDLRATKKALAHRRQFQALVASISSRLVMAPDDEADAIIETCMKDVCNFANADGSTMFWLHADNDSDAIAYIWGPEDNPFGDISMQQLPKFGARLRALQSVRIDDVTNLPEEFRTDKATLEKWGIKSVVVLPMVVGGEAVGGMTCGRLKQQRDWTDQEVEDLKVFAELFANFVLRLKSRRALDKALRQLQQATDRLEAENVYLRQEIELTHGFDEIIGRSDAVLRSLQLVEQVAPTRTPVLIVGETGTGKELVARAIHELSDRCARPLVKVNCAALPANLIESELFGHEKGAFTGADNAKRGRFDLAHGSTLFLDEIGEIPIELQSKLLRVLQEGEFDRLGGGKTIKVDVRLIVATNRDLVVAVRNGEFRSDLYYRINTFPIEMPPLRDRGDDIQLLADHFIKLHAPRLGRDVNEISAEMMDQLRRYSWPGNVRELEGIIQRALISSSGPVLNLAERLILDSDDDEQSTGSSSVADLKFIEREHIVAVLEDASWKIAGESGAAAKLGIPPSTLRSKMKKLQIVRPV
ncbi:MAG: GAF domain-containing protein [Gammaproteobacteria bacterium]|nr:GAF domain-containing protein [Gammaproteobacteria bacterium]